MQAEITGNYFARANLALNGYLGNQGSHDAWTVTGNEIYDPPGGIHLPVFVTKRECSACSGADGSFKIRDADVWDLNTYGGTFVAQVHCNNTNSGNSTLTQWRDRTDNCRVTPDGGGNTNGFDLNSTNPANPTTDKVVVVVNEYQCPVGCPFTDQARGNIYCVNWDGNSTCSADISSVVGFGKQYKVRYPRDFFGTVAAEGTCPGSGACNVSLPTKREDSGSAGRFANAYVITGQP